MSNKANLSLNERYISCGCNKIPHAADWGSNGLVAFASGWNVIIFQPSRIDGETYITQTLMVHKSRVNAVRWMKNGFDDSSVNSLVSCGSDKLVIVWQRDGCGTFYTKQKFDTGAHVTISDSLIFGCNGRSIIAAVSTNSFVTCYEFDDSSASSEPFKLNLHERIALDVRLAILNGIVIMALALDNGSVAIHARNNHSFDVGSLKFDDFPANIITGHSDWVRALEFTKYDGTLFLASASQDTYVRIYRFEEKIAPQLEISEGAQRKKFICLEGKNYEVLLETVLSGHESWVYGVSWQTDKNKTLRLLTSSMDKSLVVWEPQDGLWMETARVGEIGGNTLGFYGGKFSPDGYSILAHGYQGSFHLWRRDEGDSWQPDVVVGGHVGPVTDLSWAPSGQYLLTCGSDQTTRLHAPWLINGKSMWHEIARPQVHGHDMSCVASISNTRFVSGSEEKVLRAFSAPRNFLDNFLRLCGQNIVDVDQSAAPEGASVPALGLSNKPVYQSTEGPETDADDYFSPLNLTRPPTEENLMQNTLWPEVQKLYGHGYEIYCVAARSDGAVIASACRASQKTHAAVILWNTSTWVQLQRLEWHQLTVTQIAFSPNGKYLLTVSRDRKWCLHRLDESSQQYEVFATGEKSPHTRIIWCCAWSSESDLYATGSRDGVVCIWKSADGSLVQTIKEPKEDSVTALAFSPVSDFGTLLIVGTDSGLVHTYVINETSSELRTTMKIHSSTVKRIQFRPGHNLTLATCSDDGSVKMLEVS